MAPHRTRTVVVIPASPSIRLAVALLWGIVSCASGRFGHALSPSDGLALSVSYVQSQGNSSEVSFDILNCGSRTQYFIEPIEAGTRWYSWIDPDDGVATRGGDCSGTVHPSNVRVALERGARWRVPCEPIEVPADVSTSEWALRVEVIIQTSQGEKRLVTLVPPGAASAGECNGGRQ